VFRWIGWITIRDHHRSEHLNWPMKLRYQFGLSKRLGYFEKQFYRLWLKTFRDRKGVGILDTFFAQS
jgi:hypothetical protein